MRVCVVYDCLYPHTVGGAERWYRNLAERLAAEGHEVTYLTLRQWNRGERAQIDERVRVVTAGPRMALYTADGRRRILPPLVFGLGVLLHLLRHGRRYDVVHTCAFPYFSLLAAALVRPLMRFELVVDWFEVWSRSVLARISRPGRRAGRPACAAPVRARAAASVLLLRAARRAPTSRGIARLGHRAARALRRQHRSRPRHALSSRVVLFAARLIPEKQVTLAVAAMALAAKRIEGLRGEFLGDGPERAALDAAIAEHGLQGVVAARGFTDAEHRRRGDAPRDVHARDLAREGYGLVVVEAAARGTPSVVVAGEDNAATELIEEGVNGTVAPRSDPDVDRRGDRARPRGGVAAAREHRGLVRENADRLSLEPRSQRCSRATSSTRRSSDVATDNW